MRYKGTSENPEKTDKATNGQTQKIKVKTEGPIVFVFYALFSLAVQLTHVVDVTTIIIKRNYKLLQYNDTRVGNVSPL